MVQPLATWAQAESESSVALLHRPEPTTASYFREAFVHLLWYLQAAFGGQLSRLAYLIRWYLSGGISGDLPNCPVCRQRKLWNDELQRIIQLMRSSVECVRAGEPADSRQR